MEIKRSASPAVADLATHRRRRDFERDAGQSLPPVADDFAIVRDAGTFEEVQPALQRLVVFGPPDLDLLPLLADIQHGLMELYVEQLGPLNLEVHKLRDLPLSLTAFPRVAAVCPLLDGRTLAQVIDRSPLAPLETCAVLAMFRRAGGLRLQEPWSDRAPPAAPWLERPLAARRDDALYAAQQDLALGLRGFQLVQSRLVEGYTPWARCKFLRAPAPPPPDPQNGAAVILLVDTIQDAMVWEVTSENDWRSGEFLGRALNAMVVLAPVGRLTVLGTPYVGRPVRRTVTATPRMFTALRVEPGLRRWRCEETEWGW